MTNLLKNSAIIGAAALSVTIAVPAQAQEMGTSNPMTGQAQMMYTPEMIMDFAGEDIAAMIAEMEAQGYEITDISRTILGRIKVMMQNDEHSRSMFFSRSTGELKQDFIMPMNMGNAQETMNNMMGSGSTNGSNNGSMGNMGGSTSGNMGGSTGNNMGGNSSGNMGGTSNNNMGGSNMGGSSNSGSNMMGSGN